MSRIQRLRRAAFIRVLVLGAVDKVLVAAGVLVGCGVLLRVAERLELLLIDWGTFWVWGGAIGAVGMCVWIVVTRPDPARVSRLVDEAAGLPQSVSTVDWLGEVAGGWATAVRAQTEAAVSRVRVSRLFPVRARRRWVVLPVMGLAFFGAWLMPSYDLAGALMSESQLAEREERDAVEEAGVEVAEVEEEMASAFDESDEDLRALLDDIAREEAQPQASTPEDVRARAVMRMSRVSEQLDDRLDQDEGIGRLESMRDRLAQLRDRSSQGAGLKELSRALQRGDFKAASEAMRSMESKLGQMSDAERTALAQELQELAEQLAQLAEDRAALEAALGEAGLDPALASDMEALKNALEQMQGMTQEQREALMQMAQQTDAACKQCKSMSQCMMDLQAGMCKGGDCSGRCSALDAEFAKLAMAQKKREAMSALQAKLSLSMCKLGASPSMCSNPGGGSKGSPYGSGDSEIEAPADGTFAADAQKSPSIDDGSTMVIGRSLIDAGQVKGESRQTFREVMLAGGEAASRAMEDKQFPKEYHDAVRAYFSTGSSEEEDETPAAGASPE
jgi:hypothetical protein